MKTLNNQKGMTLVELLAVLVIGAIVSLLAFNVLFSMLKNEDKVAVNAQLRDEADYYMASLTNTLYTLNESNVCDGIKESNHPNNGYSYIITSDNCLDSTKDKFKTGFDRTENGLALYVNAPIKADGKAVPISSINKAIKICNTSKLVKDKNIYKITLTLLYNGHSKTFKSEVHSIPN